MVKLTLLYYTKLFINSHLLDTEDDSQGNDIIRKSQTGQVRPGKEPGGRFPLRGK